MTAEAMPGANTSHVVQNGRRWRAMYQNATMTARIARRKKTPPERASESRFCGDELNLIEVDDKQQQLRPITRPRMSRCEVEHSRRVEPPLLGAPHRQPEAQQIRRGEEHAVGVDGDRGRC